jgi:antitoxin VapB
MTLNIKDPEAHRLAAAISEIKGISMTRAVTEALREDYERLQSSRSRATVEELLRIAKRASAQHKGPYVDHAELLYDENGLPK